MRHVLFPLLLAALLLPLTACDYVVVSQPIGRPYGADLSGGYDGEWRGANPNLPNNEPIRVRWLGDGRAKLIEVNTEQGEEPATETARVTELRTERWGPERFIHIPDDSDNEDAGWAFARIYGGKDVTLLALPRADVFTEAIESGELEGHVESEGHTKTVHITADPESLRDFITARPVQDVFKVEKPVILTRRPAKDQRGRDAAKDGGN